MTARTPTTPNRVLILGRSGEAADPLAFLLNIAGYEVLAVEDESQAVAAAEAFQPALCVLTPDHGQAASHNLARELRSSLPDRGLLFAEWGTAHNPDDSQFEIDLRFADADNNFDIAEKIDRRLSHAAIVA